MKTNTTWVIIPARSGSKSIRNKNIKKLLNIPLFVHSINFAKRLKFIDKIFFSTDSKKYGELAKQNGAFVPFLRSKKASSDKSMEEDILDDIRLKLKKNSIKIPDNILWIRPTTPLRDLNVFYKAYNIFKKYSNSVCVVNKTEPRIFFKSKNFLKPVLKRFYYKSMIRRQDCPEAFKIFYGEFFKFPKKYKKNFLGEKVRFIEQNSKCDFDLDYVYQFKNLQKILQQNKKLYEKFLFIN
jgi:CMP-N,N'-diacetyllegionaminic acid synthase